MPVREEATGIFPATHNLMQYDTPDVIYSKPTNLFVARFIGSPKMNTFEVESSGETIRIGDQDITVKAKHPLPPKVIVGIRPEHVVVGAQREGPTITARVAVTENLGHERLVFTETTMGPMTQRASDQTVCPNAGDELELTLLRHRLHFFDAVTEERIEMVSDGQ
ncbi:TOBE domain-containing protein [Mesorhizobium sp. M0830]|uniref:TOBE domain-containing protein n=1 Tax=Mesorhizobium sp. M0830 TaxID=2957008 RepID=UPI00333CED52